MKKPMLTTLGLAGACAAGCAIPILVPLTTGLSVAGMIGFNWEQLSGNQSLVAVTATSAVASVLALGIWTLWRRRSNASNQLNVVHNEASLPASLCGCSGATSKKSK